MGFRRKRLINGLHLNYVGRTCSFLFDSPFHSPRFYLFLLPLPFSHISLSLSLSVSLFFFIDFCPRCFPRFAIASQENCCSILSKDSSFVTQIFCSLMHELRATTLLLSINLLLFQTQFLFISKFRRENSLILLQHSRRRNSAAQLLHVDLFVSFDYSFCIAVCVHLKCTCLFFSVK